ncbi:ABC transporter substrate-binding protein [Desulfolutivibrio sp.]|uniref:ABC transporter substrate-binding protein n=1 Tax=Desulfolutivibrio sp. TaxID=2773296 RepID=UPI002F968FB3
MKLCRISPAVSLLMLCLALPQFAAAEQKYQPVHENGGEKWRIGFYQGGEYNDYAPVTKALAERLAALGWIKPSIGECLATARDSASVWTCLAQADSDYLEFVADAFWTAQWKDDLRQARRADFISRATTRRDLDLVLALGTWAGQDLATDEHDIPVVVCSTSNALFSGIVASAEDSGHDHVHARVDPTRYARQVRLFQRIVGFKRLGVVYEHSREGISYAGMDQIEPLSRELGFELVTCEAPFSGVTLEAAEGAVLACHEELAAKVDAVYLTIHRGLNMKSIGRLLEPLFARNIPTFAMGTLYEVNAGAMMSMAQPDFRYAGDFYAETMARILRGERPRDISQILLDPQDVRVNIAVAKRIGFHLPVDIISDAQETLSVIEDYPEQPDSAGK